MNTYLVRLFSVCLCLGIILLIIPIATPGATNTQFAEARISNDYGIVLSQTCYNIHRYAPINSTSPCPTYEAIMLLYPDTSDQKWSGEFIYKHNQLQRGPAKEGHYDYYRFSDKSMLFIDPPADTQSELKMIRIESSLSFFKPRGLGSQIHDGVIYQSDTRYIDSCRMAVISAENWINLIGDTLNYMRHGCDDDYTEYNFLRVITQNLTKHDIATSNKWLHEQFIEWVKENCLFEYDKC